MKSYAICTRMFAGFILIIAWGLHTQPLLGVVLILLLTALSAARYRFNLHSVLIPIEIGACVLVAFHWYPAMLGLWFAVIGLLENKWAAREKEFFDKRFDDTSKRIQLEKQQEHITYHAANAARFAELNERSRIAQDIHDHVGHDITGALIALQTAVQLYHAGDTRADELLNSTIARLEDASATLRETVYNLKPAKITSIMEDLCEAFTFCEISYSSSAVLHEFSELFAANLKEALTNVARHSNATKVTVRLDDNDDFIRMIIADNGKGVASARVGMGLTGMKERVRNAGGTLTISTENGYKITQILPKRGEL